MTWIEKIAAADGITAVFEGPAESEEQKTDKPWELPVTVVCAKDPDDDEDEDTDEDEDDLDYFYDDDEEDEDFDEEFDDDIEEEDLEEEEDGGA